MVIQLSSAKKITVIGGSGFVGTNLCRHLESKQQDFEIIDLKMSKQFPEKCKIADVRDLDSLRKTISGDVVVLLAAVHRDDVKDKFEYQKTNINGAKNVTLCCEEKGIRKIIFTSTVAVYGFATPGTDETGAIKPFNEYGRTKFAAEEKLREWYSRDGNSLIIVRPTVIFGEGNRGNVYNLFNQIALGKFIMIGKGYNKKSMAYISNFVSFLDTCIKSEKKYALINYVDTPDLTMNQLVSHVRSKLTGSDGVGVRVPYWLGLFIGYSADISSLFHKKRLPISAIRVKKFVTESEFASSKCELDDFTAPFELIDGIQRTIESEFISPDPKREIFYTE
jgi:nucleoside-diphosphate-sugar epimerase